MATQHVKVFEEKKKGLPIWAWLIPLLIILALILWWLLAHKRQPTAVDNAAPVPVATAPAPTAAAPDLGAIHFATDKADLTPEAQATLQRAAEYLKQNPSAHMRIEGFTDSAGPETLNMPLSDRRAMAAGKYLESQGIDASRLTGKGFAAADPVAPNSTAAGMADNRRVELFQQQ